MHRRDDPFGRKTEVMFYDDVPHPTKDRAKHFKIATVAVVNFSRSDSWWKLTEEPTQTNYLEIDYYTDIILPYFYMHDEDVLAVYYIVESENEHMQSRKVYNLVDFLADSGGAFSVFYLLGLILVSGINDKLAQLTRLQNVYRMSNHDG